MAAELKKADRTLDLQMQRCHAGYSERMHGREGRRELLRVGYGKSASIRTARREVANLLAKGRRRFRQCRERAAMSAIAAAAARHPHIRIDKRYWEQQRRRHHQKQRDACDFACRSLHSGEPSQRPDANGRRGSSQMIGFSGHRLYTCGTSSSAT
jgi:hypothetical protein